jgi:beta-galactosidase
VWDAYSPVYNPQTNTINPNGGYAPVAHQGPVVSYPNCDFRLNSLEDLSLCFAWRYWEQYALSNFVQPVANRTTQGIMIGGAKIIYQDSSTDGRMQLTEVARVGGVLDGVRIIKDPYYVLKVAASPVPDIHILGHWNYAAGTTKKMYVASNTQAVSLAVYDANDNLLKDYGMGAIDTQMGANGPNAPNHYIFTFPNVSFQAGKIKATGLNGGTAVVTDEHVTTGMPAALKLTPIYGPYGWFADGADIAMVDIEVVDAKGLRVPIETTTAPITFKHSGAGTWIGGYNSGMAQTAYPNQGIFKDQLMTDAGINRVLVRSTTTAGSFTITVSRQGLADQTVTLTSQAFPVTNGLATTWPQRYDPPLPAEPTPVMDQ